jgi:MOSC domain-containing protein YiiM
VASGRSGFYLSIVDEGDVASGDAIHITRRAADSMCVADVFALKMGGHATPAALRRAASIEALTPSWREHFRSRLSAP